MFKKNTLTKFRKSTGGNVAMMFGIMTTVLFGGTALALDGSRLLSLRSNLQDITDAAALAGAYVADSDPEGREAAVLEAVNFHLASVASTVNIEDIVVTFDDASQTLKVRIESQQDLVLAGFLNGSMGDVDAVSVASYAIEDAQPVSIVFVLDVSGSMDRSASGTGASRIETLKQASGELFSAIEEASLRPELLIKQVRTGMVAYNGELLSNFTVPMQFGWLGDGAPPPPPPREPTGNPTFDAALADADAAAAAAAENAAAAFGLTPDGGTPGTLPSIQGLIADGRTNSSDAFDAGARMLRDDIDTEGLRKFVIFMTDGNNNEPEYDTATIEYCELAKEQGLRVFTVAFEAPQNGQDLLEECASNPKAENFYDASNASEFRAAFRQIGEEIGEQNTRLTQ